jgi:hypothetical protein
LQRSQADGFIMNIKMKMNKDERNSKGGLFAFEVNMCGNENICPYTLESADYCKMRNSIVHNEMCFFMLEPCYFPTRDTLKAACV